MYYDVALINMLPVQSWAGSPSNNQDTQGQWMYSVGKCRNSGSQRRTKWPSGSTWTEALAAAFFLGLKNFAGNTVTTSLAPWVSGDVSIFGNNTFASPERSNFGFPIWSQRFFRNVPSCQHKWDAWRSSRNQCPSVRLGAQNVQSASFCRGAKCQTLSHIIAWNNEEWQWPFFKTNGGIFVRRSRHNVTRYTH